MGILRAPLATKNFTQVPNHWLRDKRLSARAKGILAYICSHAAGYDLTVKQMVAEMKDGQDAIYAGMKELEDVGYLKRERRRGEGGRLGGVDYIIVESPSPDTSYSGFAQTGETQTGSARSGSTTSGESGTKNTRAKNTTTKNTTETDLTCTTSDRSARFGGGDEDSDVDANDSEPDDNSSWRAEDRAAFQHLIGEKIRSTGVNGWNTGTFNTDDLYGALRRKGGKPMKWPGRYLHKLIEDDPTSGLVNWLDDQGFELL